MTTRKEQKEWREKNKEHWKEYTQNYREKNKEHIKEVRKSHEKTNTRKKWLKNYSVLGKPLSEKQSVIWNLYSKGMTCSEIAAQLHITPSCITAHIGVIKNKLGITKEQGERRDLDKLREYPSFLSQK